MRAGTPLDTGDTLPGLSFDTLDHGRVTLPDDLDAEWGLLVVVRAAW